MVKKGDKVMWIGEDIYHLKKGGVYIVTKVDPLQTTLWGVPSICLDITGNVQWSMVNFKLLSGLDLAKLRLKKRRDKINSRVI